MLPGACPLEIEKAPGVLMNKGAYYAKKVVF